MFSVYILANTKHGAIFTGQCDDLIKRIREHKMARFGRSASAYSIDRLMWFESYDTREAAFKREREIKAWKRERLLDLFQDSNPDWSDLSLGLTEADLCLTANMPANQFARPAYPELAMAS